MNRWSRLPSCWLCRLAPDVPARESQRGIGRRGRCCCYCCCCGGGGGRGRRRRSRRGRAGRFRRSPRPRDFVQPRRPVADDGRRRAAAEPVRRLGDPSPRPELLVPVEARVVRGVGRGGVCHGVASEPLHSPSSSSSPVCVVCEHGLEGLLGHVAHRLVRRIAALRVGSTRVRHARSNGAAALRHRAAEPRLVPSLAQPLDASQRLELDVRRSVLDAGREVLGGVLDLLPGQGLEHTRELIEQVGCDRGPGEPCRASGVRARQWFDQRFDPE